MPGSLRTPAGSRLTRAITGFDDGQAQGLSFDEMMDANEDAWLAVEDWRALAMATLPDRNA